MNSVKLFDTTTRYFLRQKQDIAKYGKKKKVKRYGLPFVLLNELTPNRRLSDKPVKLSDPKYFIDKYEKENPKIKYYVKDWDGLCEDKKVDYIVKERYSELIINKIMNHKLKNLPMEQNYSLNMDGEIVSLDIGKESTVDLKNYRNWFYSSAAKGIFDENLLSSRSVHNHPVQLKDLPGYIMKNHPKDINKVGYPLSDKDVANCYGYAEVCYVADSFNHKYKYTPFRKFCLNFYFVKKIKAFVEKQLDIIASKKTGYKKELEELLYGNHDEIADDKLADKIYDLFYKFFTHDTRNIQTKSDCLYALSDFGKYEQLK